jgi:hypothetical protein
VKEISNRIGLVVRKIKKFHAKAAGSLPAALAFFLEGV